MALKGTDAPKLAFIPRDSARFFNSAVSFLCLFISRFCAFPSASTSVEAPLLSFDRVSSERARFRVWKDTTRLPSHCLGSWAERKERIVWMESE